MAKVAFVFPGQGAQQVGMGKAAFDGSDIARRTFESADAALDAPLSRMCFEGPDTELQLTANSQPAILATSIALLRALGERCDVVAGHSLGEYSANVCAGTLGFEDAVRLVRKRGLYMQDAVPVGQGAMAAVLGGDAAMVEAACREAGGTVEPVNYNCPGQLVLAGETAAVHAVIRLIETRGAKAKLLPVSAPFHCALMKPAEQRLEVDLRATKFAAPEVPIYVNVDAAPIQSADAARDALVRQVSRPVRWQQAIERMVADGVGLFVEIGPGKALTGMIRRIAKDAKRANVESPADFEAARKAIAEARG
ncbi:MAG TPA: ACP S-malonyltransferase [Polyangiales bacterium]|jgi:[acyl-carrier-protein] S-malonyltransferase|nr:ACP S-malonyltransferase [Polyangiales bacterium]